MQCVRTLPPQHSSTVKINKLKRHVPNMQTSNQFLSLTTNFFTVDLISSIQVYHRTNQNRAENSILNLKQPAKIAVSNSLLRPRFRGSGRGSAAIQ